MGSVGDKVTAWAIAPMRVSMHLAFVKGTECLVPYQWESPWIEGEVDEVMWFRSWATMAPGGLPAPGDYVGIYPSTNATVCKVMWPVHNSTRIKGEEDFPHINARLMLWHIHLEGDEFERVIAEVLDSGVWEVMLPEEMFGDSYRHPPE